MVQYKPRTEKRPFIDHQENFDSQPILKCYSIEISSNSKTLTKMNIRLSFSLQRLKALLKTETYEYGFKERISENWS